MLKKQLLSIFNIEEEELHKTVLLTVLIFLIITSLLIIKPIINSLFLHELTSSALPLGYVLTALAAILGSFFYNRMIEKRAFNNIVEGTLIGSIVSLILFGLAFRFDLIHGFSLFIPYIWVAIFGLLTASQFWILANLVYNIRVAKRVFGLIGSGAILGGIVGGYITSILTLFLKAEDLLFVAAVLLCFCIPIVRYIWKHEISKLNSFQKSLRSEPITKNAYALIRQSKLLTLIALVIGISVIVAKLVDFQYSYFASKLIEDPEDLASFFGFWFSTLSLFSLFIQLFITKKIVGVFGVGKSLLGLPLGILIGTLLLILVPQLWVVVIIKIIEGSLKNSVNKSVTELLSIPVPIEIKKRTKTFIDVVIDSIATGIAGFILILFINVFKISSVYISLIIVGFILYWIYLIFQLRKEYGNSFKALFIEHSEKKEFKVKKSIPLLSISDSVKQVFLGDSESQVIFMLQKSLEAKEELFFPEIKQLLKHPSPQVRELAIENLYFLTSNNLSKEIELMLNDHDQAVTTAAFRYLIKFYKGDLLLLFEKYLNHTDETLANSALIGLSTELRNYSALQERFNFHQVLKEYIDKLNIIESVDLKERKIKSILLAIGNSRAKYYYSFIKRHIDHDNIEIQALAIKSAGATLDQEFIDEIAEKLSNKNTRKYAIDSLYGYGDAIIEHLVDRSINGEISYEASKLVPQIVGKFANQKAVNGLIKLIDECEHSIKIKAIFYLTKLKWNQPNLTIKDSVIVARILDECELYHQTLSVFHSQILIRNESNTENEDELKFRKSLITILENRMDRQLERIFKFLGLKFPPQEIDAVLNIMVSGKVEQRIQAIEFLDNILDIQLKKELIPIAEATMLEVVSKDNLSKLNIKVLSEKECFEILLKINDDKIKLAVLALIKQLNASKYIPLLEKLLYPHETKKVQDRVNKILDELSND